MKDYNSVNQAFNNLSKGHVEEAGWKLLFENFYASSLPFLYNNVIKNFSNDRHLGPVLDYFGAYDTLLNVKQVILRQSYPPNDFIAYLNQCVKYDLLNKKKLKEYTVFNKLTFTGKEYEKESAFVSQKIKPGEKSVIIRLTGIIEELYQYLETGGHEKIAYLIKYFNRVLEENIRLLQDDERILLSAQIDLFKAHFFFEQGKLNLSRKYVIAATTAFNKLPPHLSDFLLTALNLQGALEINLGSFNEGERLLQASINTKKPDTQNPAGNIITLEGKILYAMFVGTKKPNLAFRQLQEVNEFASTKGHKLSHEIRYAWAYFYIDNNRFEKADEILQSLDKDLSQDYSVLNAIRILTAKSELLTAGFHNYNTSDLSDAFAYLQEAKKLNETIGNKYFNAVHKILEGVIEKNFGLIKLGINELKSNGYLHYHKWYSERYKLIK